jgi:hypothetical protein
MKIIGLLSLIVASAVVVWFFNGTEYVPVSKEPTVKTTTISEQNELTVVTNANDFVSIRPEIETLPAQTLSDTERSGLLYMREEEKLARDVYTTLYDTWGLQIFSNIAQSEQTHTEAVRSVIVKYGISDPVTDDTIGVFTNNDLQKLYTDLSTRGKISVEEALTVGALIEDLDIADLQKEIAQTDNDDIKLVYENLMRGSRNHLRSFISQLTSRGVTYSPKYITQTEFDTIIASEQETGFGGGGGGRGWGKNR